MARIVNNPFKEFFAILFILFLSSNTLAQNSILSRKISIDVQNKRTGDVLNEISKKGRFYFSYSSDLIQKDKLITVRVKNISIQEIIKLIFEGKVVPIETGKYLILKANTRIEEVPLPEINIREEKYGYTVTGYIIDANSGQKLSNASIYEIGKTNSVLTNFDGYYNINIGAKDDYLGLAYSHQNFKDTIIVIQPANHSINMRLRPKEVAPEQIDNKGIETIVIEQDSIPELEELPLVKFAVKKNQFNLSKNLEFIEEQHFQVSLIPQFGTNNFMSGNVENNISLNILGGYSYAVKGFELGGLLNIVRNDVVGFQIAGFSNIVGENTKGTQIAGFSNNNRKSVKGVQIAGFSNFVLDTLAGTQISGFSNVLKGKMKGIQLSGFSNISNENVDGIQISGFSNFARKNVNFSQIAGFSNIGQDIGGAQISGFSNYSGATVKGIQIAGFINQASQVNSAQIAGFINISRKEIKGFQMAGFINVAKKVKGVQLGFINIADSVSGLNIGFISLVKQGMHKAELSIDEVLYSRLSIKTGTHHFYNIFSGGFNVENAKYWTVGYGIGSEFRSKNRFYYSIDLHTSYLNEDFKSFENINFLVKLENHFGWNLLRSSGISFGPTFNVFVSDWKDSDGNFLSKKPPYEIFSYQDAQLKISGWIGGIFVIRF